LPERAGKLAREVPVWAWRPPSGRPGGRAAADHSRPARRTGHRRRRR